MILQRKKVLFSALLLAGWLLIAAQPQLARLHYDGGGDWYNDRDILPNIAHKLNATLHTDFSADQAVVKPGDSNIFDYPVIFMTGHGNVIFNQRERENLRRYLANGGFLYIDDDYGMDASIRRELALLYPEYQLVELPAQHPLFHCYYTFSKGTPKIHKHNDKRPQTLAILDNTGRILVLYTYETNISDGWSNAHDDPDSIKDAAFKMGVNIFYYLLAG